MSNTTEDGGMLGTSSAQGIENGVETQVADRPEGPAGTEAEGQRAHRGD